MSNNNDDLMSPDASPGEQSNRSGVKRVNNVPLYIVGAGLGIFLLIMVLVASDRAAKQNQPKETASQAKPGNTSMYAKEIAGNRQDGIVQPKAPALTPPAQAHNGLGTASAPSANLDMPPSPPTSDGLLPPTSQQQRQYDIAQRDMNSPDNERQEQLRASRLQQFEEAVKARSGMQFTPPRSAASSQSMAALNARDDISAKLAAVRQQLNSATQDDPTAAYKARLAQLQAAGIGGGATASGSAGQGLPGMGSDLPRLTQNSAGRDALAQFAGSGEGDRWQLNEEPEAPRSRYELRAGFVVPATLISGINSELPGQIVAQVSQDVYDSARGIHKLIPQGSRLVGRYANEVAYGQSRILIGWQRIIFPDGKALDIGSMPGADSAGYAGFKDQVNNHYFRLFGSAFLMSAVTAGITLSQPEVSGTQSRPNARQALSEAVGQQLGQATAQIISKNLNISPTLEIRPGYRFNVMVTKDMTFSKPYKAFDY